MPKLRLRGDWSDTGPEARPERDLTAEGGEAPMSLHATLMHRMTQVLSRMLNDPATRAALNPSIGPQTSPGDRESTTHVFTSTPNVFQPKSPQPIEDEVIYPYQYQQRYTGHRNVR